MNKQSLLQHDMIKQAILFIIVGVATVLIDLSITALLYYLVHFPAYASSAVGFLSGFAFNFPMNRKRVFNHSDNDRFNLHTQIILYTVLCIFNLVVSSIIVDVVVNLDLLAIQYAKLAVTVLIAVWNFVIYKLLIFSKR